MDFCWFKMAVVHLNCFVACWVVVTGVSLTYPIYGYNLLIMSLLVCWVVCIGGDELLAGGLVYC